METLFSWQVNGYGMPYPTIVDHRAALALAESLLPQFKQRLKVARVAWVADKATQPEYDRATRYVTLCEALRTKLEKWEQLHSADKVAPSWDLENLRRVVAGEQPAWNTAERTYGAGSSGAEAGSSIARRKGW